MLLVFCAPALCPASAQAVPQRYRLEDASTQIRLRGRTPLHDFEGVVSGASGRLQADPDAPASAGPASVRIPVSEIRTGNDARDHALQYTLAAARQPDILYEVESASASAGGRYRLKGTLSIGGASRPLELDVASTSDGSGGFSVEGRVDLKLSDYRLQPPALARFMGLRDEVSVTFRSSWRPETDE